MEIMTPEEYEAAMKEWHELRTEALEVSVWEAREERFIHEVANAKRDPILAKMRKLDELIGDYRKAKHKERMSHESH